jgi:arylsulfatase A-like enzyme
MDITATILAATGAAVPPETKLDGIDLLPILAGRAPAPERTLFWRFGGPTNRNQRAVRQGDWKLLIDAGSFQPLFLFNLRADPGERNDLSFHRPEIVARLRPLIDAWEKEVEADATATLGPPPAPATATSQ